jgi:hypothetical protein
MPAKIKEPIPHFWSRVDQSAGIAACWPWTKCRLKGLGYGHLSWNGRLRLAHVVSWMITHGQEPPNDKPCICHSCDNPPCCNPSHLWAGTIADNAADRTKKGRSRGRGVKGDEHWSRKHPERCARGDDNGARIHIERLKRGSEHVGSKLTEEKVQTIRRLVVEGITHKEIGNIVGVARRTVGHVVNGDTWKHV